MLVVVEFLVEKDSHTLYRSVLNLVNRSGEFISTRGRKIHLGGRLYGANMSPKLIFHW